MFFFQSFIFFLLPFLFFSLFFSPGASWGVIPVDVASALRVFGYKRRNRCAPGVHACFFFGEDIWTRGVDAAVDAQACGVHFLPPFRVRSEQPPSCAGGISTRQQHVDAPGIGRHHMSVIFGDAGFVGDLRRCGLGWGCTGAVWMAIALHLSIASACMPLLQSLDPRHVSAQLEKPSHLRALPIIFLHPGVHNNAFNLTPFNAHGAWDRV
ncbi:hypothetical protein C8J57DRAFT_1225872 [Mycena rebaudengoi]|nr:hypothetical protein C8J57DRAFT_1225872 [Mycena rebaudengoi]